MEGATAALRLERAHSPRTDDSGLRDPEEEAPTSFFVQAQYDFTSTEGSALSFRKGDVIEVLTQLESGWWDGLVNGKRGWMPCNYVKIISDQEAEEWLIAQEAEGTAATLQALNGGSAGPAVSSARQPRSDQGWSDTQSGLEGLMTGKEFDDLIASHDDDLEGAGVDAWAQHMLSGGVDGVASFDRSDLMMPPLGLPERETVGRIDQQTDADINADDFWVPSLADDGRIYYHNTQTGQNSWEMPSLPETSPSISSTGTHSRSSSRPGSHKTPWIPTRLGSSSSYAQLYQPKDAAATGNAGFGLPRLDPRTGKPRAMCPWLARMTDDGANYVYVNKDTGETRRDLPAEYATTLSIATDMTAQAVIGSLIDKRLSMSQSDASGLDSPGMMSASRTFAVPNSPARSEVDRLPERMTWEERLIESLTAGAMLQDGSETAPALAASEAAIDEHLMRISRLVEAVATASRDYSTSGNVTSGSTAPNQSAQAAASVLRDAVAGLTPAIRKLLYVSRYALFGLADLIATFMPELSRGNGRHNGNQNDSAVFASPEEMHTPQRRLIAALSKMVFYCHSAVGMDWPVEGTAERLGQDATDLEKAVRAYVAEVKRIGCLADGDNASRDGRPGAGLRDVETRFAFDATIRSKSGRPISRTNYRRSQEGRRGLTLETVTHIKARADEVFRGIQKLQDGTLKAQVPILAGLMWQLNALQLDVDRIDITGSLDVDPPASAGSADPTILEEYNATARKAISLVIAFEGDTQCLAVATMTVQLLATTSRDSQTLDKAATDLLLALDAVVSGLMALESVSRHQQALLARGIRGHFGVRSTKSAVGGYFDPRRASTDSRMSKTSIASHLRDGRSRGLDEENEIQDSEAASPSDIGDIPRTDAQSGMKTSSSQSSLGSKPAPAIRPRKSSNASASGSRMSPSSSIHSLSQTLEEGRDQAASFRTSSLMKAMPFLRGRGASDADRFYVGGLSPGKTHKKKLAKILGEENVLETLEAERDPPRLPQDRPFYLGADYADDDIIFNIDGSVKAGTVPALVERLTAHDQTDFTFTSTFLITYRSFATGLQVVDLLINRYTMLPPPGLSEGQLAEWEQKKRIPVKLRVFNILKQWLDQYYIDEVDSDIIEAIRSFATEIMAKDRTRMPSEQLLKAINRRLQERDSIFRLPTASLSDAPPSILPRSSSRNFDLLDIDPRELARQLTLLESNLYGKIKAFDCLNKAWSERKAESGKNIKAMILTSNRMAGWVAEAILSSTDVRKRATIMKHFVQIAKYCKSMNNFSSMAAIMAGLNSTPIRRLKRTREQLGTKTLNLIDELDKTLDSGKNFAAYRAALKMVDPPCIPFLGVYLTFLTFVEDGNTDTIPASSKPSSLASSIATMPSSSSLNSIASAPSSVGGSTAVAATIKPAAETGVPVKKLVHFFKRQKAAEIIREIQSYQMTRYNLNEVKSITDWIQAKLEQVDKGDDEMYELSMQLEPREKEEERVTRALRESGMI